MKQETDKGEMKAAAVKYMRLGTDLEAKEVALEGKVAWVDTFLDHCNVCGEYGHNAAQWPHCDLNHRAAQCTFNLVNGNGKGGDQMTGVKGVRCGKAQRQEGSTRGSGGKGQGKTEKVFISPAGADHTE